MIRFSIAFYIIIGILVSPSFIVMEEMFYPNTFKSKNKKWTYIRTLTYYLLWPLVLIYYRRLWEQED